MRETFYTTGMEHSPTSATGTGWERTPWHATRASGVGSATTGQPRGLGRMPSALDRQNGLSAVPALGAFQFPGREATDVNVNKGHRTVAPVPRRPWDPRAVSDPRLASR